MKLTCVIIICIMCFTDVLAIAGQSANTADDTPENCAKVAPVTLSDQEKQELVGTHNKLRKTLETATIKFKEMQWDEKLAGRAQLMVNTCVLRHSYYKYYCPLQNKGLVFRSGQNYLRGRYDVKRPPIRVSDEIEGWWEETKQYNHDTQKCEPGRVCGHYLQMAWSKTYKVGCAYKMCEKAYVYDSKTRAYTKEISNQFFLTCNYYPAYLDPDRNGRLKESGVQEPRPYDAGCMTTPIETTCNGRGSYDYNTCSCKCQSDYYGYWCEFQDSCKDTSSKCPGMAGLCNLKGLGDVVKDVCPKTCGVC